MSAMGKRFQVPLKFGILVLLLLVLSLLVFGGSMARPHDNQGSGLRLLAFSEWGFGRSRIVLNAHYMCGANPRSSVCWYETKLGPFAIDTAPFASHSSLR